MPATGRCLLTFILLTYLHCLVAERTKLTLAVITDLGKINLSFLKKPGGLLSKIPYPFKARYELQTLEYELSLTSGPAEFNEFLCDILLPTNVNAVAFFIDIDDSAPLVRYMFHMIESLQIPMFVWFSRFPGAIPVGECYKFYAII